MCSAQQQSPGTCYWSLQKSACRRLALQRALDNNSLTHTHTVLAPAPGSLSRSLWALALSVFSAHTNKTHVLQRLQSYSASPRLVPHAHGAGASTTEAYYGLNYPLRVNLPGIGPSPSRRHKRLRANTLPQLTELRQRHHAHHHDACQRLHTGEDAAFAERLRDQDGRQQRTSIHSCCG